MATTAVIGAVLLACGLVYMAASAIFRGRLTEPHVSTRNPSSVTLEPRPATTRFLGVKNNWPGLLLVGIGVLLLLVPVL